MNPISNPCVLCGISIPRSGHHWLERLLQALYGQNLFYCEFYTPSDCCNHVPCSRGQGHTLVFTKNHDFGLNLPTDLGGAKGVIQHRAPLPGALSDLELMQSVWGKGFSHDRYFLEGWLARKAAFIEGFHARWVKPHLANCFQLPYEHLLEDPDASLYDLLDFCNSPRSMGDVRRAVAQVSGERAQPIHAADLKKRRKEAFQLRHITPEHLHHRECFARFERLMYNQVDTLTGEPLLSDTHQAEHIVDFLYAAAKAGYRGETERAVLEADAAISAFPNHPYGYYMKGKAYMQAGHWEEASHAFLESRQKITCPDPEMCMDLTRALWEIGDGVNAVREGATLIDIAPHDPHHRALYAMSLWKANRREEAITQAQLAQTRGVSEPFLKGHVEQMLSL